MTIVKAHLRYECFYLTSYFVTKGNCDITSNLYSGRLFVCVDSSLGIAKIFKNQNKYILGSAQLFDAQKKMCCHKIAGQVETFLS